MVPHCPTAQGKEICLDILIFYKANLEPRKRENWEFLHLDWLFSVGSVSVQKNKIKPFSLQHTDMDN